MKVLITEKIADDGINILKEFAEVDIKLGMSHQELVSIIDEYDAIIVRSATKVNEELINTANNLKVIGRAGTGVDNVDVDAATKRGILVVNTPEGNSNAAAEMAIGLMFAVCRQIPQAYHNGKNKDYRRGKFKGVELNGKTLGVVGLGRIGSIVASRLKGFDMKVLAYDPYISDERCRMLGVERYENLHDLLKQSDIVTLHMPKLNDTVNLIGEKEIEIMKDGARIINCARGGLIDEKALYTALKSGKIAAAGLDVLEEEPNFELKPEEQSFKNSLLELDNVIFTPHLGASTVEAQYNVGVMVADQVSKALKGEIVSAVNLPAMQVKNIDEIKAYIELAEKLGRIYFQAEKVPVKKIEILYSGKVAELETKIITLAFIKGLLEPITADQSISYVNAAMLLRARGIEIVESKSQSTESLTSLVTAVFKRQEEEVALSGAVFGNNELRLVDFFGYHVDFELTTPYAIAFQNIDKPGMIGRIGTILGGANVNIASMRLSRNRRGEKAVAFLAIDSLAPEEAVKRIKESDGVLKVSQIGF